GTSNAQTFTISAASTISSLNPACATAGGPQFTLTVTGTNYVSGSTVNWNGSPLATAFVSATQLSATVPAALIATAGTASVTVVSPCGGTSNAQTFTVAATPVITSPLTACGTVGSPFSYTITATNNPTSFTASPLPAGLSVNTSTGVISGAPTQANRTTTVTITASNGAGTCNTATALLVITIGTAPTIGSISPTCTAAGGPQFILTVTGPNNDFIQGDTVYWNGSPLVTTFQDSRPLKATVPANNIATPGNFPITVVSPCGGTSNAITFPVDDAASITSLVTASATLGTPFSYQITADNSPTSFDATDLPGGLTVCHNSGEGCTPGLISGTPTAT